MTMAAHGVGAWATRGGSPSMTMAGDGDSGDDSDSNDGEETRQRVALVKQRAYARRRRWLDAGRQLDVVGFAVVDGVSSSREQLRSLRASVAELYERHDFSLGCTGSTGKYEAEAVRGDRILVVDTDDTRLPALAATMCQADRLVATMARSCAGLRRVLRRSTPTLACYPGGGAHYVRHLDNAGLNSRLLTCITYLNEAWRADDGGALRIHHADGSHTDVEPFFDRCVLFWSDARTPHEVLPCHAERWAVTVWCASRRPALPRAPSVLPLGTAAVQQRHSTRLLGQVPRRGGRRSARPSAREGRAGRRRGGWRGRRRWRQRWQRERGWRGRGRRSHRRVPAGREPCAERRAAAVAA